VLTATPTI